MPGPWGVGVPALVSAPLTEVAERTGGRLHSPTFGRVSVVNGFSQAFEDFRQSYILHYTPTGVARVGWHEIQVHVPAEPRLTIRARKGTSDRTLGFTKALRALRALVVKLFGELFA